MHAPHESARNAVTPARPSDRARADRRGGARLIGLVAVALAAALLGFVLLRGAPPWEAFRAAGVVAPPARALDDLTRTEPLAESLERALTDQLVGPVAGAERGAPRALLAEGLRATLDDIGAAARHGDDPERTQLLPGGARLGREALLDRLFDLVGGWDRHARLAAIADRFVVDADAPDQVYARVRLRWAGWRSVADEARIDVRLVVALRATAPGSGSETSNGWRVDALQLVEGEVLEGTPRFRDVAREVGFTWAESARNRELGQAFVDQHRTLALGGLSIVDFDRDGFPDVLAARAGEFSVLFRNDRRGGFIPEPLPPVTADEHPALFLFVDLDGDGREELIPSRPTGYEGDRAFVGLWTRRTDGGPWEHLPRAFALPNPVGLRRLAIQTVVPFDLEGDGDLDLFFAVYGSAASRGEHYNTVDASDGADNHLAVNQGQLTFSEESDTRGITGTRYTYVATAFDFDSDGDLDLFEGNDFGPNYLWLNDGKGYFTADESLGFGGVPAYTMGATLADFDNSGRWSLYVSNMSSEQGMRMVPIAPDLGPAMRETVATIARGNMLYTEPAIGSVNGPAWIERSVNLGVNEGEWAWGCSFVDVDNDGDKDLYVTNGFTSHRDRTRPDFQTHYWRQVIADGRALERGERAENTLSRAAPSSFNGYEHDRLFFNLGGTAGRLPDAAFILGTDADHDGRAVAPLDMDGDGDLDLALWTLRGLVLYENLGAPRNWVRVDLRDPALAHPPLGAIATVRAGGVTRRDVVKLVDGFQTQVHHELHFGLGDAAVIDELEVRWPNGDVQIWRGLDTQKLHVVTRGAERVESRNVPRWPEATRPEGGEPRAMTLLAGAVGRFDAPHDGERPLVLRVARPGHLGWPVSDEVDVAPRDVPSSRAPRGVRFARVLADGAWTGAPAARRSEADLVATPAWLKEGFGRHFGRMTSGAEPFGPDAATAVFDARAELVRMFRYEPTRAELEPVLALAADEPAFPGLLVEHGRMALTEHRYREAAALFQESLAQLERDPPAWEGLGRAHVLLGRFDLAEQAYAASVRADADYGIGHYNLGVTRAHLGRPREALGPLQEALRIEGKLQRNLLALGEAAAAADELELALGAYTDLVALDANDVEAHVARGKILARSSRYDDAAAALERALTLSPQHAEARAALAKVRDLRAR
jgi:tetratricopeptide (TPR) repeat protein